MLLSGSNSTRLGFKSTLRPRTSTRCSSRMRRTVAYRVWSYCGARVIETFEGGAAGGGWQPARKGAAAVPNNQSRLVGFDLIISAPEETVALFRLRDDHAQRCFGHRPGDNPGRKGINGGK